MKRTLKTALVAAGFATILATAASACGSTQISCIPNQDPGVNFKSTPGYVDTNSYVPILVCHTWWDKLWGDPSQGSRWWGPTKYFAQTGWSADLAASHQECKWFYMVPGEAITTEVSCFGGALATTGPISASQSGQTIWLQLVK